MAVSGRRRRKLGAYHRGRKHSVSCECAVAVSEFVSISRAQPHVVVFVGQELVVTAYVSQRPRANEGRHRWDEIAVGKEREQLSGWRVPQVGAMPFDE